MENFDDDYKSYWENNMFLQPEELDIDSYLDDSIFSYSDSSSPDGTNLASKNIVSERNRRKRMNERLYALRSVVPNITKMDKASIIKDAIEYIKTLHEEEKEIQAEITELESGRTDESPTYEIDQVVSTFCSKTKRTKMDFVPRFMSSPIQVLELKVSDVGDKTVVVSLTCSKKPDTVVKLCQVFESLKLKVITATVTAFPGRLLKTLFIEADEEEKNVLKLKIEAAIAALNDPDSPMSM